MLLISHSAMSNLEQDKGEMSDLEINLHADEGEMAEICGIPPSRPTWRVSFDYLKINSPNGSYYLIVLWPENLKFVYIMPIESMDMNIIRNALVNDLLPLWNSDVELDVCAWGLTKDLSDSLGMALTGYVKIGRWWSPTEKHIKIHQRMTSVVEEYLKFAGKWTAFPIALSCFGLTDGEMPGV